MKEVIDSIAKSQKERQAQIMSGFINTDLSKGGEGSKGGKIIGHTTSGKPIYDHASHSSHKKFTAKEHKEAAKEHRKLSNKYSDQADKEENSEDVAALHDDMNYHEREYEKHTTSAENKRQQVDEDFENQNNSLEKGKKMPIGTKSGDYIKTSNGWRKIGSTDKSKIKSAHDTIHGKKEEEHANAIKTIYEQLDDEKKKDTKESLLSDFRKEIEAAQNDTEDISSATADVIDKYMNMDTDLFDSDDLNAIIDEFEDEDGGYENGQKFPGDNEVSGEKSKSVHKPGIVERSIKNNPKRFKGQNDMNKGLISSIIKGFGITDELSNNN